MMKALRICEHDEILELWNDSHADTSNVMTNVGAIGARCDCRGCWYSSGFQILEITAPNLLLISDYPMFT